MTERTTADRGDIKKGRIYWNWKAPDPVSDRAENISLTRKLAKRYRLEPTGRFDQFTRMDAVRAKWLFEQELAEQVREEHREPEALEAPRLRGVHHHRR